MSWIQGFNQPYPGALQFLQAGRLPPQGPSVRRGRAPNFAGGVGAIGPAIGLSPLVYGIPFPGYPSLAQQQVVGVSPQESQAWRQVYEAQMRDRMAVAANPHDPTPSWCPKGSVVITKNGKKWCHDEKGGWICAEPSGQCVDAGAAGGRGRLSAAPAAKPTRLLARARARNGCAQETPWAPTPTYGTGQYGGQHGPNRQPNPCVCTKGFVHPKFGWVCTEHACEQDGDAEIAESYETVRRARGDVDTRRAVHAAQPPERGFVANPILSISQIPEPWTIPASGNPHRPRTRAVPKRPRDWGCGTCWGAGSPGSYSCCGFPECCERKLRASSRSRFRAESTPRSEADTCFSVCCELHEPSGTNCSSQGAKITKPGTWSCMKRCLRLPEKKQPNPPRRLRNGCYHAGKVNHPGRAVVACRMGNPEPVEECPGQVRCGYDANGSPICSKSVSGCGVLTGKPSGGRPARPGRLRARALARRRNPGPNGEALLVAPFCAADDCQTRTCGPCDWNDHQVGGHVRTVLEAMQQADAAVSRAMQVANQELHRMYMPAGTPWADPSIAILSKPGGPAPINPTSTAMWQACLSGPPVVAQPSSNIQPIPGGMS